MKRLERIKQQLESAVRPSYLLVEDESHQHSVPEGSESHFKVTVVSEQFEGMLRVKRHQLINSLLMDEFNIGLHALSLQLFTPIEWEKRGAQTTSSPQCRGGSKHG